MYQSIQELAYSMRLNGINASLERRCEESLAQGLHPSELIRLLLEDERLARRNATARKLTTRAKFRSQCDLDNWDANPSRGLSKAKLKELAVLNFYHKKENLILEGKTGVGKTHLAIALGRILCQAEVVVAFYSVNLLLEQAASEKVAGKYLSFIHRLKRNEVIILDDFGLRDYTHDEASFLLEILEERYGKGMVIISTQVNHQGWRSLFKDPVIAEAIVDRLVNPSEQIELKGESYRKKRQPS